MIKIVFEANEVECLHDLSQNHPHRHVRRKAMALILKSQGVAHHKITASLGISGNTFRSYCREYLARGIESITTINFRRPESRLVPFKETIEQYLQQSPPSSIKQACHEIGELTGVTLKETQMRCYLKSLGVEFRKVGSIPAKADIAQQKKFLETELQPRLEEAKSGKREVFFLDSAHFVLGAFLGYLWSLTRIFVKTPSGRQRFNVLGAMNAITKELITITNDTYITSIQVCDLLKLIAQKATRPATVVLDNARYQRCQAVTHLAHELGIELLFLPPYSPNLNLIERVWKFTKKRCLSSKYYPNFCLFKNAISMFLTNMYNSHAIELETLLTLNFQIFTEEQLNRAV